MTTKDNSICENCHWNDQCGEEKMIECNNFDQLTTTQEYEDMLIQDYIDNNRRAYKREWECYMDYINNDKYGDDYDL